MKIVFEYGRRVTNLPALPEDLLLRAGKTELKLLLALGASPELCDSFEQRADQLAAKLKVSRSAIDSALSFWVGAGIISREEAENASETVAVAPKAERTEKQDAEPPKRSRVSELPQYTGEEFARVLERRGELKSLIDEAQEVLGRIFNTTETQILVSISEGLGLDDEYILNLLAYCKKLGKPHLRYVERTACSLYDKGICNAAQLEEYLKNADKLSSAEGQIRRIFGIGERAFTSKESKFLNAWVNEFGFEFEMIKLAYEETVNATSKPSMHYANKVLESWHAEGITTPEALKKAKEKRSGASAPSAMASSFNVDEFFTAAINNGFGDENKGG